MESHLSELKRKITDQEKELTNVQGQRNRVQSENDDISRRLQDCAGQIQLLERAKLAIAQQVEELKVKAADITIY